MIFLVEYDRSQDTAAVREFADDAIEAASEARLARELELLRSGVEREVVLLQARDRAALERTHGRYFLPPERLLSDRRFD
jgi:hypothetical protein